MRIDRMLLRESLGLPDKLPRDYEAIFMDHEVPLGLNFVRLQPTGYGPGSHKRVRTGSFRATVVIKRGPSNYWTDQFGQRRKAKSSAHRIFIICPTCKREIPAGRWHQHVGTTVCQSK